jgi:hypothetical protein
MADRHYTDRHPDILDDVPMKAEDEPPAWADGPVFLKRIVWAVYGICAVLLVIDPFVHKHGPFAIEHWWGFYGIYGFIGCVFLVLAAKEMRRVLLRPEDYYDKREGGDDAG